MIWPRRNLIYGPNFLKGELNMNKLKWWFRIVGGFYLLLAVSNLYVMFLTDGSPVLAGSPFPVEPLTIRVATDY